MVKIIKKIKKKVEKTTLKKKAKVRITEVKIKTKLKTNSVKIKSKIKDKLKRVFKRKKSVSKKVSKTKKETFYQDKESELKRYVGNPIIFPANGTYWESQATFNPTAFINDGKIHVLYRAVGMNEISTIGYALSKDGYSLTGRTFRPVFIHSNFPKRGSNKIIYSSGGGWNGGAEDPRITKIGDMLYMTYTAFDGWGSVRIGLTSITLDNFLKKNWNWRNPVLISPPGQVHKNWVLFPEKIKGKFAMIHSISPEIMIEYVDDMNSFDGDTFIKSIHQDHPLWKYREKGIRGIGGAPIKTKYGWLVFYHGMEPNETHRYKLWAMLLDLKNPTKILYKSKKPILEPDAFYENEGHKSGVVYSCGSVIKNNTLFIYYGGADMVSCVATTNLELFLKDLMSKKIIKLNRMKK